METKSKTSNILFGQDTTGFGEGAAKQIGFNVGQFPAFGSSESV